MTHYVGMCVEPGFDASEVLTKPLRGVINEIWLGIEQSKWLQENKADSRLITMGYAKTLEPYHRGFESFTHLSVVFIDCDNLGFEKDIIDKFNKKLDGYEFWTYETSSSTPERPKFRGIVPLDSEIEWNGKKTKDAIGSLFKEFVDDGASWFYEPTLGKIGTLKHHDGVLFPSARINGIVESLKAQEAFNQAMIIQNQTMIKAKYGNSRRATDPHNLPKVKEYLNGSWSEGTDRRPRANSAIYSMVSLDIPPDEIYAVIMEGPAAKFRSYLRDSFRGACSKLHKILPNPF